MDIANGTPEQRLRIAAAWAVDDNRPLLALACRDGADEIKLLRGIDDMRPMSEQAKRELADRIVGYMMDEDVATLRDDGARERMVQRMIGAFVLATDVCPYCGINKVRAEPAADF